MLCQFYLLICLLSLFCLQALGPSRAVGESVREGESEREKEKQKEMNDRLWGPRHACWARALVCFSVRFLTNVCSLVNILNKSFSLSLSIVCFVVKCRHRSLWLARRGLNRLAFCTTKIKYEFVRIILSSLSLLGPERLF